MRQHLFTALLVLFAVLISVGQYLEHRGVVHRTESALEHRAQDLSAAFSVVIRSQGRGARMSKDRLEHALVNLVQSAQLESVVLLDESGNIAASAGAPLESSPEVLMNARIVKSKNQVAFANLIALGPESGSWTNRPPDDDGPWQRGGGRRRNAGMNRDHMPGMPPPGMGPRAMAGLPPRWMSHEEYDRLVQSQGIHWFLVTLSTRPVQKEILRDLVLRFSITGAVWIACIALAAAWHSQKKSAHLALALVSAEEATGRLRELNTTAAGLMHETRNPLNLIRGMAQMIEQDGALPEETRTRALSITEEVDRIAGRLNQFLDFARPPTPQVQAVMIKTLLDEIVTILSADLEEKAVDFTISGPDVAVEADAGMLRQMIFNLVHNAVRAVNQGGQISLEVVALPRQTIALEVNNTGQCIPEDTSEEIFQPYVSHFEGGTGLGLPIVRQLARAQGWDVRCLPRITGASFRICGMKTCNAISGRTRT